MASVNKVPRTLADGTNGDRWVVRYKDGLGVYRSKAFARKKEADAYRAKVEVDLRAGNHISPGESKTVARATALLLEHVDHKVAIGAMRPGTARNYHSAFKKFILPMLGHRLVLDVKSEDLEAWFHKMVRSGDQKPVTAYRRLFFVRAMFDFAKRRHWCHSNPASTAMEMIGKPKETAIETFDVEMVQRVIAASGDRPHKGRHRNFELMQIAVHLGAFCGLRWGEIFGLRADHVDIEERTIRIRHSLDDFGNLQEPKTKAGIRNVPLPQHLAELIAAFILRWPNTNADGLLLANERGNPMLRGSFWKSGWVPLQSRAGVQGKQGTHLRFHALRHFACSWMIENGWPIPDVSSVLGHANVTITLQVYAHSLKSRAKSTEAMQELADKLLRDVRKPASPALTHDVSMTHEQEYADFIDA